jgi:ribosome-associated protein
MTVKKQKKSEIDLLHTIIDAIQEVKGKEIVKIGISTLEHSVCDYFVICHGDSTTHVNAIAGSVERFTIKEHKEHPLHVEGKLNSQWILLDYGNVAVHVFQEQYRQFYNLEDLWSDGNIEHIKDLN